MGYSALESFLSKGYHDVGVAMWIETQRLIRRAGKHGISEGMAKTGDGLGQGNALLWPADGSLSVKSPNHSDFSVMTQVGRV